MPTQLWLPAAELQAREAKARSLNLTAIGLSAVSGLLAFVGMWLRYSQAASVPLPGMDQLGGQFAWAALLAGVLLVATYVVRGVVMQRLQWAVAISLLLHLLLCVSMQTFGLRVPLQQEAQADELPGRPLEEMQLPDHGDVPEQAAWDQPAEVATPERQLELERKQAQAVDANRPEIANVERPLEIAKLNTPQRQEQDVRLAQEQQAELERQMRERELKQPQAVAQPDVKTQQQKPVELDAQVEQTKRAAEALQTERKPIEVASTAQQIEATKVDAQRNESKPQQNDPRSKSVERSVSAVKAVTPQATDSVRVTSASQAKELTAQEQRAEVQRQQAAAALAGAAGGQLAQTNAPTSAGAPRVSGSQVARATNNSMSASAAPSAGGAAAIARRTSNPAANAATGGPAQTIQVASAAGVGAPQVGESTAASAATRGTAASVPLGSATATGTASNVRSQTSSAVTRGTGGVARPGTGSGQPTLGNAGTSGVVAGVSGTSGSGTGTSSGAGRGTAAVGSQAGDVQVASAGTSGSGRIGGAVGNGPSGTLIGRQATGLPSNSNGASTGVGSGTGPGTSTAPSSGSGTGVGNSNGSGLGRGTAGTGLAARGTEPSAKLGADAGFSNGSGTGLSTTRSGADAKLPVGVDTAEQAGKLVIAGPQAVGGSGLGSGPQMASVPRRSAGLPGSGGPSGSSNAPPSGIGVGQPTRLSGGPSRSGIGDDRPQLASSEQVAGLIKQSVPGIGATPEAKISASLSLRKSDARREAAKSLGGSTQSEEAVERGLEWLVKHQHPDGRWSIHKLACKDHQCAGHGSFESDTAATGLALLAFLGAGYTHQSGPHQEVVERGLKWIVAHQKPDGDLFADKSEFVWFYSHGMAAIALCEAYGMTKDAAFKTPAQRSLDFIVASQHPQFGGWRYKPRFESDTSVSGWQLMALKSGEMSGLAVSPSAYEGIGKWLDSVESKTSPGQYTYHPSRPVSLAMTAEGLLMRQYLGANRSDPRLIAGADFLRRRLPDLADRDAYFWYYGTQVMFHMQGEHWSDWNAKLRDTLVGTQLKDGAASGSWNPDRPMPEKWAAAGGRHYLTCLNLLMLEVYYRHLPLYVELGK